MGQDCMRPARMEMATGKPQNSRVSRAVRMRSSTTTARFDVTVSQVTTTAAIAKATATEMITTVTAVGATDKMADREDLMSRPAAISAHVAIPWKPTAKPETVSGTGPRFVTTTVVTAES